MKKIILIWIILIISLVAWIYSYADAWIENEPILITPWTNSIEIMWDKIDWAKWYYIYYSETSWKDYKSYWSLITENKSFLNDLEANKTYYVIITYLDENGKESWASPEWAFTTLKEDLTKFSLDKVESINFNEIELTFSKELDFDTWAIREFKITKDEDIATEIKEIKLNKTDNTKLNILFENNLNPWEYKITVIYITDTEWKSIEEGINWESKFSIPETFEQANNTNDINYVIIWNCTWDNCPTEENQDTNTNNTWETTNITDDTNINNNITENIEQKDDTNIDLNSANTLDNNTNINSWLAWTNLTWEVANQDSVAMESNKLPQTWPETYLLWALSLLVGLIIFNKKRA